MLKREWGKSPASQTAFHTSPIHHFIHHHLPIHHFLLTPKQKETQKANSLVSTQLSLSYNLPLVASSAFIAPMSDFAGRKLALCLALTGVFAKTALFYLVFFQAAPFYLLFIGNALAGNLGIERRTEGRTEGRTRRELGGRTRERTLNRLQLYEIDAFI